LLEEPLQIFFPYGEKRIDYCRNEFLRDDYIVVPQEVIQFNTINRRKKDWVL